MVDLGVLDNVIGVVVVILLLSMIVQSLQSLLKKLSKFKSRQIEKSLQRLFEKTAASAPPGGGATANAVLEHFRDLGRTTAMNKHAVESIAKADLSKVVATIEASSVLPEKAKESIGSFLQTVREAQQALDALVSVPLPADAAASLADLRHKIAPLVAHAAQLIDDAGSLKPQMIARDVLALPDFPSGEALKLVMDLQVKVEQAAAAAKDNDVLQKAAAAAKNLATAVAGLHARLADMTARLRERVDAIEQWYDTVMQGFEERYARHMRTWAFIISLVVAVALDADLSRIYKHMATDDVSKQRVLAEATAIQNRYLGQIEAAKVRNEPQTVQELTERFNDELNEAKASYPALGLELLDLQAWWHWTGPLEKAESIFGWLVMAFLLSLGAPFWHDTLESLFGLKNLLRSKTEMRNVEQRSGEGNPKT